MRTPTDIGKRRRHLRQLGETVACGVAPRLLMVLVAFGLNAGLTERLEAADTNAVAGRPTYSLAGRPAPFPSSAMGGLVLVAHDTGPQAIVTERPASCVIGLHAREEAQITIPLRGLSSPGTLRANATALEAGKMEVSISLQDETLQRVVLSRGSIQLTVPVPATTNDMLLRLTVLAHGSPASVRWQDIHLRINGQRIDLPLFPGGGNVDECPPRVLPPLRRSIEQALIEWDWRMQDGIGTERAPSSHADALEKTWQRGNALLQDLQANGVGMDTFASRWQALDQQRKQLLASLEPEEAAWEELWRQAHLLRREMVFANPLARTGPVAFIKQVPGMFSHQLTQYYGSCARPGGGLFVLEAPGQSMACRQLAGQLPLGSYQHLEASWEGDRLLFAYCQTDSVPKDREQHLERFYHLYEIAANGSGLRQLTTGPYDDFSPRYLPDGKILSVSTRRGGYHRCGRGPCAVYTLTLAEPDGSQPRPISYHETHEWDPAVLPDGRIIYTRWDYVDRHAVYYEQLWSVRPDGSDVRAYYGNNTFNPVGVWEARPVPGSTKVMATAAAHHAMTAGSILLLDTLRGMEGMGPITRLTPDALFPESEAPVILAPNGFWSAPAGLDHPPAAPPEAVRWPGHCYRSAYPLSEKYFYAAYSFDPLIGEPTWNRANMFGLYLVDAFGNKELLYRDLNIASLWPTPLLERARPRQMTTFRDPDLKNEGTFFMQNVYASWPALPRERITHLRIVQVLPKSTPHANQPMVGLANASPGKQVLGTVPVESDGSAYFRAPAGIPLAFQALDEHGQAVQIMRSLTYLQPGEHASCIGCHTPRDAAPALKQNALASRRTPSVIAPGPDGSKPLSYPLLVQPVLDRLCVSCHNPESPEGKVVLTGAPQGRFSTSYNALAPRVAYSDWAGRPGDFRQINHEPLSYPGFFGARGSELMRRLTTGHYGVVLNDEDFRRLTTWMDVNALFYGTFDEAGQASQQLGQRIDGPKLQ